MKKFLALILAMAMSVSVVACGGGTEAGGEADTPPQQEETVKKTPVSAELFDEDGNKLADIALEYDDKGNLLSNTTTWVEDWGGTWEKDTYTYNENGDMLTETSLYEGSDYETVFQYEYNENGQLVKTYLRPDDSSYTGYTYDENGHAIKRATYMGEEELYPVTLECDAEGRIVKETEVWDDWEFVYTTTYNDAGDVLKWEYACNGEIMLSHNYDYDADGLLVRQDCSIESWKMEGYVVYHYE